MSPYTSEKHRAELSPKQRGELDGGVLPLWSSRGKAKAAEGKRQAVERGRTASCILLSEECFMHIAQGGWWGWSYRSPTPGEETLRKHRSMEEVANLR